MYGHPMKSRSRAPLAVALQRSRAAKSSAPAHQKLLVPLDGSYTAEATLFYAVELAKSTDIAVHLLNVQPKIRVGDVDLFRSAHLATEHRRTVGEQIVMRAKRALDAHGIPCTTEVAFGEPAEEIARSAASNHCDKIVMVNTSRRFVETLLHRSVVQRVVKHAAVPVTIVKSGVERTSPALCLSLNGLFEPTPPRIGMTSNALRTQYE